MYLYMLQMLWSVENCRLRDATMSGLQLYHPEHRKGVWSWCTAEKAGLAWGSMLFCLWAHTFDQPLLLHPSNIWVKLLKALSQNPFNWSIVFIHVHTQHVCMLFFYDDKDEGRTGICSLQCTCTSHPCVCLHALSAVYLCWLTCTHWLWVCLQADAEGGK